MVECTCYANIYGNVVFCPFHESTEAIYEALLEYQKHNKLHHDEDARLLELAEKALNNADKIGGTDG